MNRLRYNDDKVNARGARRGNRTPDSRTGRWPVILRHVVGIGGGRPRHPAGVPLIFSRKAALSMSSAYEQRGRTNQKHRTRNALVAAARELLAQGVTPTVEEAAALASISRAT